MTAYATPFAPIAMDELYGWTPPDDWRGVNLAVLPIGVFEFDPLTGERRILADHPVLAREATFRQTLAMVEALAPNSSSATSKSRTQHT
ncbi:MAG: hypothetical protein R3A10_14255 [Caldilineaceae bacterium]